MRRSLLPTTLAFLLLAACGGGSSTQATCTSTYWDGTIGTCMPEGWSALSQEEVQARGMPPEVVIAFQSVSAISGQYPTVAVTRERLPRALSSAEYSKASIDLVTRRKDYAKIDATEITVDGDSVTLHVFSAQPLAAQPKQRFYQVAAAKEDTGYVFTASLPLTTPDKVTSEVKLILSSMTFQPPAAE
ncbi:MAG: hypothetical protein G01um101425_773 [Candidatus Peregrinibacteria bacterium Gr01-1014_25]|nr:MAG: hypothetical protein G01um101425_773 [Candidatus Peregrinibacteria bacterium Gr01-1014_25]